MSCAISKLGAFTSYWVLFCKSGAGEQYLCHFGIISNNEAYLFTLLLSKKVKLRYISGLHDVIKWLCSGQM